MNHDAKTAVVGVTGFVSTKLATLMTLDHINAALPVIIGCLTVAGLIPLVLTRWIKFLNPKAGKDE